jgi:hypothetical protein
MKNGNINWVMEIEDKSTKITMTINDDTMKHIIIDDG